MAEKCETLGDLISRIAKENGVDPQNPEFRARLMAALIGAGYFSGTGKQPKETEDANAR